MTTQTPITVRRSNLHRAAFVVIDTDKSSLSIRSEQDHKPTEAILRDHLQEAVDKLEKQLRRVNLLRQALATLDKPAAID